MTTKEILINAKSALSDASLLTSSQKNDALYAMAENLIKFEAEILEANKKDLQNV